MPVAHLRRFGALLALSLLAQPLAAQNHESTATGSGRLTMRGLADVQITRSKIKLETNGKFDLQLNGARPLEKWSIEGQFVGDPWERRVELRLTKGLQKEASGTGTVTFDANNAIEEISLQGSNSERAFQLTFRGDGSGGTPRPVQQPDNRTGYDDRDRDSNRDRDTNRDRDGNRDSDRDRDSNRDRDTNRDRDGNRDRDRSNVDYGNFDRTADGRGTLRTRSDNDAITRMRVRLANDGTATLRAEGPRQATTFRARWRNSGNARIDLDVIEMNGRRVEGSGTLGIRGRDFDQVDIQVRSGADGRVDLRFRTDGRFDDDDFGNGNGNNQVPPSYNGSRAVRGTIDLPGSGRVDVRRVQVKLERNGDARVRLQTERRGRDRNIDIVGTWQANRNGSAELRWSRIDNVTVSGTGLITFWNGRDLDRIRGLARSRDGRISVDLQVSQ